MKNSKKGFIIPLLVAIIAVLIVGSGAYIYSQKKSETLQNTPTTSSNFSDQKTYVWKDGEVTFQYPATWKIVEHTSTLGADSKDEYIAGLSLVSTSNERVDIGGKMVSSCEDVKIDSPTKCVNGGKTGLPVIYTTSNNNDVKKVFNAIVKSMKKI